MEECPVAFKPVFYRRYVDDTFLLFRDHSHIKLFFDYLNCKHDRIRFTCETENNNSLSFLDISVCRGNESFSTSTYRKPTFTGLGTNYSSAVNTSYKLNLISCLVDRAYKINSSYHTFCEELDRLRSYFCMNGYSYFSIENFIRNKLNSIFEPTIVKPDVPKQKIFVKIPFMSAHSNKLIKFDLIKLVSKFYPQIDFNIIFTNDFSIGSFFLFKDKVSPCVKSNIVYKYSCGLCSATYIGESTRHYQTRVSEHRGISPRTGLHYSKAPKSNIYNHFLETGHDIHSDNFSVIFSGCEWEIKLAESIKIHQLKPSLNDMVSSTPLNIL